MNNHLPTSLLAQYFPLFLLSFLGNPKNFESSINSVHPHTLEISVLGHIDFTTKINEVSQTSIQTFLLPLITTTPLYSGFLNYKYLVESSFLGASPLTFGILFQDERWGGIEMWNPSLSFIGEKWDFNLSFFQVAFLAQDYPHDLISGWSGNAYHLSLHGIFKSEVGDFSFLTFLPIYYFMNHTDYNQRMIVSSRNLGTPGGHILFSSGSWRGGLILMPSYGNFVLTHVYPSLSYQVYF